VTDDADEREPALVTGSIVRAALRGATPWMMVGGLAGCWLAAWGAMEGALVQYVKERVAERREGP
jgi:hypothetical protein